MMMILSESLRTLVVTPDVSDSEMKHSGLEVPWTKDKIQNVRGLTESVELLHAYDEDIEVT